MFLPIFLLLSANIGVLTLDTLTNCSMRTLGCVRCDPALRCTKCHNVMMIDTRQCLSACASGSRETWSAHAEVMGRVCLETGALTGIGLDGQGAGVAMGAVAGLVISMAALLAAVVYFRRKKLARLLPDDGSDSTLTVTSLNTQERAEFSQWVAGLRPEAPAFLAMLNDTRRQARAAASPVPYRPVLRDLATLLLLLNRPPDRLGCPPPDWRKLLAWADLALRRFHADLLPDNNNAASLNRVATSGSAFGDTWDMWDARWDEQPSVMSSWGSSAQGMHTLATWSASRELISEADYAVLGFRPQDEITTEL